MIDIEELELEFNNFFGDKENEHTLLARMFPLIAEVKRLQPMADELIAIWEILEEDYPQVDRAIVKELIKRKIGDYEVIE